MYLIICISEGAKCVMYMAKDPADVLLHSSRISVCTIGVFMNTNLVQRWRGWGWGWGGGGGAT